MRARAICLCGRTAEPGRGRCRDCRLEAEHARPNSHQRGYDHRWQRTRGEYLAAHPTCERVDCAAPARDVHHLDGLGPLGPRGHDWSNLEALCGTCHKQTTAQLQPGGWNARS